MWLMVATIAQCQEMHLNWSLKNKVSQANVILLIGVSVLTIFQCIISEERNNDFLNTLK